MRVAMLNTLMGAVSFAALVITAPLDPPDTCIPSTTTLFVTVEPSTITIHDASTSAVYITVQESVTAGHINTTPLLSAPAITLQNTAISADPSVHYVTVTETALVTAHVVVPTSSSDNVISYYVTGTSTVYLDGKAPTDSVVYATGVATLTVEPEPPKSAKPVHTSTSSGKTTISITEHRTVTGVLSAPTSSTLGTNPSFTGIASGGWNGTSGGGYGANRGPTNAAPTGVVPTGISHAAANTVSSALAAQSGFGGADPASISTADPTFDFSATYPALSLSTLSAKSGFNVYTTPYANFTKSTPASSTYEAAQPNSTFVTVPSHTSFGTGPTQSAGSSAVVTSKSSASSAVFSSASNLTAGLSTSGSSASVAGFNSTAAVSSVISSASFISTIDSKAPVSTSSPSSTIFTNNPSVTPSQSTRLSFTATPTLELNQTTAGASSSATPSASACGEVGDFVLNFDDIPPLSIGNQSADSVDPAPVFSPYHQFDFSNGFVVVPPPTDPYLPSSGKQLAEFIPNFTVDNSTTASGPNSAQDGFSADIGNGDHDRTGCFRFNFYGSSVGCDSKGPSCLFTFTGLRRDRTTGGIKEIASASMAIESCPSLSNCKLTPVDLGTQFEDLTVIRINLSVGGEPKIWWMDDIRMGWTDNACETGMCRINSHLRKRQLQLARA